MINISKNPGPSAWNELLPEREPLPSLSSNLTSDWLIVGAGFAGLSAARRVLQEAPNDSVVILDAQGLASGPAGRNSGFMIDLPHDLASDDYGGQIENDSKTIKQNRYAINFAKETVEALQLPKECFKEIGKINGAATAKGMRHNHDYAKHLSKLGEKYEYLDANSMKDITGTNYYKGGLFTPGTVMIQPALYIRALGEKILSNRVRLYESSPVEELNKIGSDWQAKTPKGLVTASKVILAVNGNIENFGYFQNSLLHIYTYGSITQKLTPDQIKILGGKKEWGITPADPLGTTVRRISGIGGDRIVIRNRFTYNPNMSPNKSILDNVLRSHVKSFSDRFPMLKDIKLSQTWGGHLTLSRNNVAAFGELKPGLFSACCQNGLGTVKGTLHGLAAADLAMGKKTALVKQLLNNPKPKKLPFKPLTKIAVSSRIKLGELLAGKEL
jgi:glycine/D-amino acid oxidase-like deaminating enzyme